MKEGNLLQVSQVKLPIGYTDEDVKKACIRKLKIDEKELISYETKKKSIDARKKEDIHYSLTIIVLLTEKAYNRILSAKKTVIDICKYKDEKLEIKSVSADTDKNRPVIIGSGPAGLFCAYVLAVAGLKPIIIEQGQDVEKRSKTVEKFWTTGELSETTNVQFGEGGAGTFSDGKLNTMVKDPFKRIPFVLETFVKFGADPEILYLNKPHIGTDVLKNILINMRKEIISLGGEYRFETKFTGFDQKNGQISHIVLNNQETLACDEVILALGHSSRDTFELLSSKGVIMTPKPFAVGVRVEHPQEMISKYQYGKMYDRLPPADYKVTSTGVDGRGVYSFCMCPGGYVVNSSSEKGGTLVNGMSYHNRDSENANSAIVVAVNPADFEGDDALAGVRFQRELEKKAFRLAGGAIPVQLFGDFIANKKSTGFGLISTVSKGKTEFANLRDILPDYIIQSLILGMKDFGGKIKGFDREDAVMLGVESRTSSPLRIVRDNDTFESNIRGIYPIGEGAGYAGGITSAAVDGVKAAEKIIEKRL